MLLKGKRLNSRTATIPYGCSNLATRVSVTETARRALRSSAEPMLAALKFLCALLTAVAMGLTLAHALKLPGKLRLDREHYIAVQAIYYPRFTFGGAAQPLAIIAFAAPLSTLPLCTDR